MTDETRTDRQPPEVPSPEDTGGKLIKWPPEGRRRRRGRRPWHVRALPVPRGDDDGGWAA